MNTIKAFPLNNFYYSFCHFLKSELIQFRPILSINGSKDSLTTGVPSIAQQFNDVAVTSAGRCWI